MHGVYYKTITFDTKVDFAYSQIFNLSCRDIAPWTRSPTVGMTNTFAPTRSPSQVSAGSSAGNQPPLLVDE